MKSIGALLTNKQSELEGEIRHREKWIREGYILVPNILTLDRDISPQAKIIFLALCAHAFKKDYAFPSHEVLQEEVGLAKKQLIKYLRELEQVGLIRVTRTGRANNYEIIYSALDVRVDGVVKRLADLKERIGERNGREK
jgi:hypothetical protein